MAVCGKSVAHIINGRGQQKVILWCHWTLRRLHQLAAHFQITPESIRTALISPTRRAPQVEPHDNNDNTNNSHADASTSASCTTLTAICQSINCWFPESSIFQANIPPKIEAKLNTILHSLDRSNHIVVYRLPYGGRTQVYWPDTTKAWSQIDWDFDLGPQVDQGLGKVLGQVAGGGVEIPEVVRLAAGNIQHLPWLGERDCGDTNTGSNAEGGYYVHDGGGICIGMDTMDFEYHQRLPQLYDGHYHHLQPPRPPPNPNAPPPPAPSIAVQLQHAAGPPQPPEDPLVQDLRRWNSQFGGSTIRQALFEQNVIGRISSASGVGMQENLRTVPLQPPPYRRLIPMPSSSPSCRSNFQQRPQQQQQQQQQYAYPASMSSANTQHQQSPTGSQNTMYHCSQYSPPPPPPTSTTFIHLPGPAVGSISSFPPASLGLHSSYSSISTAAKSPNGGIRRKVVAWGAGTSKSAKRRQRDRALREALDGLLSNGQNVTGLQQHFNISPAEQGGMGQQ